jgi:hypothetical protein
MRRLPIIATRTRLGTTNVRMSHGTVRIAAARRSRIGGRETGGFAGRALWSAVRSAIALWRIASVTRAGGWRRASHERTNETRMGKV